MKGLSVALAAGAALLTASGAALAHHSFAMFDATKQTTLTGTVKEFQWTQPHAWLLMMVSNDGGQLDQWPIEMTGLGGLARQGWGPKTLTPGMKIKVVIHPLRSGARGGQFVTVTLPDGTQMADRPGNPGGGRLPAGLDARFGHDAK